MNKNQSLKETLGESKSKNFGNRNLRPGIEICLIRRKGRNGRVGKERVQQDLIDLNRASCFEILFLKKKRA
jgi:hypothetical protein